MRCLYLLILLFSASCIKNNKGVETISSLVNIGSSLMVSQNCAKAFENFLNASKCHKFHAVERSPYDYFIKCAGYSPENENYWNKNTFRLSHINLQYDATDQSTVDSHTICTDENWRLEVY